MEDMIEAPLQNEFVAVALANREKIEALLESGIFDTSDGKFTVHFKGGIIMGVQVEKWTYQREKKLSTSTQLVPKHVPM